jgi:hypothetical protein
MEIRSLIDDFTHQLSAMLERQVLERARNVVSGALGLARGKRGRLPSGNGVRLLAPRKLRRKAPKQLCPVPGCKNAAAPVFGMVCAKHKGVPKAKIKKYREARRAAKQRAAA